MKYYVTSVATMAVDKYVCEKASLIDNTDLHAIMEGTDLIALEANYHARCMANLSHKASSVETPKQQQHADENTVCQSMAFVHVASFISEKLVSEDKEYIFPMGSIFKMFRTKLVELTGLDARPEVHTTRFRERLLYHFPQLQAENTSKEYVLV